MKNTVLLLALALGFCACTAQNTNLANAKSASFKVWGNCGMCEKTIEKSLKVDGVGKADWDKDTKIIVVQYDSTKITLDQIQRNIAAVGYDNEGYRGDDQAYAGLPECCQYDRKPGDAPGGMVKKETTATALADTIPPAAAPDAKAQVNAVLLAYYEVKNALTKDDGKTAAARASDLLAVLGKVDKAAMNEEQQALYAPLQEKIRSDAEHIAATKELKHQREHFDALSDNMWQLVKSLDANAQPAYRQYCPMVKKYWVSGEKAVKNPYYGKEMLTCGNVKETLQ